MAMFGAGGGGNFDPSNWVDYNIYNDVMKGDNGGSYNPHNHNKNKKDNNKNNNNNDDYSLMRANQVT